MKGKELIKNIFLGIFMIIICLIVFEVTLRLIYGGFIFSNCNIVSVDSIIEEVPKIGWDLKANLDACYYLRGKLVRIKTNNNGSRATDSISEKKDKFRVLLLGDSFVENFGVSDKDIMSTKLQEFLGEKYKVINTGVRGYGTQQEMWTVINNYHYKPDLIIFYIFVNDYRDNVESQNQTDVLLMSSEPDGLYDYDFQVSAESVLKSVKNISLTVVPMIESKEQKNFNKKLYNNFIAKAFLAEKINNLKNKFNNKQQPTGNIFERTHGNMLYSYTGKLMQEELSNKKASIFLTFRLFHEIKGLNEIGYNILFINIPVRYQHDQKYLDAMLNNIKGEYKEEDWDFKYMNKLQSRFMQLEGFAYIDLLPVFEQRENPEELYLEGDLHWSEKGSELVANETAEYIKNNFRKL